MLFVMGEDLDCDGLLDMFVCVVCVYVDMCGGLYELLVEYFGCVFEVFQSELVLVMGFEFNSLCEYYLLLFCGKVYVVYLLLDDWVVGLLKLVCMVDVFVCCLQV